MDDLQRFLTAVLQEPEAVTIAAWLREIRASDERPDDFLADDLEYDLELAIELSAVNLFWWNSLAALASAQHDLKLELALPAIFYSWCVGVAAGTFKPPVVTGRPRPVWRDIYIIGVIATYRRRGLPLERAFRLVSAVCGLTVKSVQRIWLNRRTLKLPFMSAAVAQKVSAFLG